MGLQQELGLPRPITNRAHEAVMNIVLTGEMLAKEGQRFLRPFGLTDSQFNVLMLLKYQNGGEGINQTVLGERLLVNRSNVTGLIDRLEQAGWVQRFADPSDRRVNRIKITRAGLAVLDKAEEKYFARIAEVIGVLSVKNQTLICSLLETVRQALRQTA
ncbi:MAG TPA: MarR family transcriptional regulator [bacterium]|nr:MarR family transcriptional regulator [Candidatus Omnitrophota bacterium]HOJ58823.1 MarR family transcriptional regulator [bacterium]HOL95652.1 MarR family transcriptional regulator [bacterium]HPP02145.1 MarR family transcriptional regulator [bacterium]HXK94066.1 MarR family transcriptional regulator [bacterium]